MKMGKERRRGKKRGNQYGGNWQKKKAMEATTKSKKKQIDFSNEAEGESRYCWGISTYGPNDGSL